MSTSTQPDGARTSGAALDSLGIVAILLISALPYLFGLGFYSDDWTFLEAFSTQLSTNPLGVLSEHFAPRPGQALYAGLLYLTFGLEPLGYHLVNTSVIAVSCVLLLRLLPALGMDRRISFAAVALFVLLPQLSTIRVWFATFQISLSLLLFLASCLCEVRAVRDRKAIWKILSLAALAASLSLYETFAPLALGFAVFVTVLRWRRHDGAGRRIWLASALPQMANVVVIACAMVLKGRVSGRVDSEAYSGRMIVYLLEQFFRSDYRWAEDYGLNAKAAIEVDFLDVVAAPFRSLSHLAREGALLPVLAGAVAIALIVFWRLRRTTPSCLIASRGLGTVIVGIGIYCLGYAVFLATMQMGFSPAGIANRASVAAAIGVAIIATGIVIATASAFPARVRTGLFAVAIALSAGLLTIRVADVGRYWTAAYAMERDLLRNARQDLAMVKADSTIILSDTCPYTGPAIIFENSWDLGGALSVTIGRPLRADVVSPRMQATEEGLQTTIYDQQQFYAYGEALLLYRPHERDLAPLLSSSVARRELSATPRGPRPCPHGSPGHGAPV